MLVKNISYLYIWIYITKYNSVPSYKLRKFNSKQLSWLSASTLSNCVWSLNPPQMCCTKSYSEGVKILVQHRIVSGSYLQTNCHPVLLIWFHLLLKRHFYMVLLLKFMRNWFLISCIIQCRFTQHCWWIFVMWAIIIIIDVTNDIWGWAISSSRYRRVTPWKGSIITQPLFHYLSGNHVYPTAGFHDLTGQTSASLSHSGESIPLLTPDWSLWF